MIKLKAYQTCKHCLPLDLQNHPLHKELIHHTFGNFLKLNQNIVLHPEQQKLKHPFLKQQGHIYLIYFLFSCNVSPGGDWFLLVKEVLFLFRPSNIPEICKLG